MFPVRQELVGKKIVFCTRRFSVSAGSVADNKPSLDGARYWEPTAAQSGEKWLAGIIRRVQIREDDMDCTKVLVEYRFGKKKEASWFDIYRMINVYIEYKLLLARPVWPWNDEKWGYPRSSYWPVLGLVPLVECIPTAATDCSHLPVLFLGCDKFSFVSCSDIASFYNRSKSKKSLPKHIVQNAAVFDDAQTWQRIQKAQLLLLHGPYSMDSCAVFVYRERRSTWNPCVISTQDLLTRNIEVNDLATCETDIVNPRTTHVMFDISDDELDALLHGNAPSRSRHMRYSSPQARPDRNANRLQSLLNFQSPFWLPDDPPADSLYPEQYFGVAPSLLPVASIANLNGSQHELPHAPDAISLKSPGMKASVKEESGLPLLDEISPRCIEHPLIKTENTKNTSSSLDLAQYSCSGSNRADKISGVEGMIAASESSTIKTPQPAQSNSATSLSSCDAERSASQSEVSQTSDHRQTQDTTESFLPDARGKALQSPDMTSDSSIQGLIAMTEQLNTSNSICAPKLLLLCPASTDSLNLASLVNHPEQNSSTSPRHRALKIPKAESLSPVKQRDRGEVSAQKKEPRRETPSRSKRPKTPPTIMDEAKAEEWLPGPRKTCDGAKRQDRPSSDSESSESDVTSCRRRSTRPRNIQQHNMMDLSLSDSDEDSSLSGNEESDRSEPTPAQGTQRQSNEIDNVCRVSLETHVQDGDKQLMTTCSSTDKKTDSQLANGTTQRGQEKSTQLLKQPADDGNKACSTSCKMPRPIVKTAGDICGPTINRNFASATASQNVQQHTSPALENDNTVNLAHAAAETVSQSHPVKSHAANDATDGSPYTSASPGQEWKINSATSDVETDPIIPKVTSCLDQSMSKQSLLLINRKRISDLKHKLYAAFKSISPESETVQSELESSADRDHLHDPAHHDNRSSPEKTINDHVTHLRENESSNDSTETIVKLNTGSKKSGPEEEQNGKVADMPATHLMPPLSPVKSSSLQPQPLGHRFHGVAGLNEPLPANLGNSLLTNVKGISPLKPAGKRRSRSKERRSEACSSMSLTRALDNSTSTSTPCVKTEPRSGKDLAFYVDRPIPMHSIPPLAVICTSLSHHKDSPQSIARVDASGGDRNGSLSGADDAALPVPCKDEPLGSGDDSHAKQQWEDSPVHMSTRAGTRRTKRICYAEEDLSYPPLKRKRPTVRRKSPVGDAQACSPLLYDAMEPQRPALAQENTTVQCEEDTEGLASLPAMDYHAKPVGKRRKSDEIEALRNMDMFHMKGKELPAKRLRSYEREEVRSSLKRNERSAKRREYHVKITKLNSSVSGRVSDCDSRLVVENGRSRRRKSSSDESVPSRSDLDTYFEESLVTKSDLRKRKAARRRSSSSNNVSDSRSSPIPCRKRRDEGSSNQGDDDVLLEDESADARTVDMQEVVRSACKADGELATGKVSSVVLKSPTGGVFRFESNSFTVSSALPTRINGIGLTMANVEQTSVAKRLAVEVMQKLKLMYSALVKKDVMRTPSKGEQTATQTAIKDHPKQQRRVRFNSVCAQSTSPERGSLNMSEQSRFDASPSKTMQRRLSVDELNSTDLYDQPSLPSNTSTLDSNSIVLNETDHCLSPEIPVVRRTCSQVMDFVIPSSTEVDMHLDSRPSVAPAPMRVASVPPISFPEQPACNKSIEQAAEELLNMCTTDELGDCPIEIEALDGPCDLEDDQRSDSRLSIDDMSPRALPEATVDDSVEVTDQVEAEDQESITRNDIAVAQPPSDSPSMLMSIDPEPEGTSMVVDLPLEQTPDIEAECSEVAAHCAEENFEPSTLDTTSETHVQDSILHDDECQSITQTSDAMITEKETATESTSTCSSYADVDSEQESLTSSNSTDKSALLVVPPAELLPHSQLVTTPFVCRTPVSIPEIHNDSPPSSEEQHVIAFVDERFTNRIAPAKLVRLKEAILKVDFTKKSESPCTVRDAELSPEDVTANEAVDGGGANCSSMKKTAATSNGDRITCDNRPHSNLTALANRPTVHCIDLKFAKSEVKKAIHRVTPKLKRPKTLTLAEEIALKRQGVEKKTAAVLHKQSNQEEVVAKKKGRGRRRFIPSEYFLQESCCLSLPKLPKCRDCKLAQSDGRRFCRFTMFRRLYKMPQSGKVHSVGFCLPEQASDKDLRHWVARYQVLLDSQKATYIVRNAAEQFLKMVKEESDALALGSKDNAVAWKRAVLGVRELCDVCATTIFNIHWVCEKCGFGVCLDCFNCKMKAERKPQTDPPTEEPFTDALLWMSCAPGVCHKPQNLTVTHIIPRQVLWQLRDRVIALCKALDITLPSLTPTHSQASFNVPAIGQGVGLPKTATLSEASPTTASFCREMSNLRVAGRSVYHDDVRHSNSSDQVAMATSGQVLTRSPPALQPDNSLSTGFLGGSPKLDALAFLAKVASDFTRRASWALYPSQLLSPADRVSNSSCAGVSPFDNNSVTMETEEPRHYGMLCNDTLLWLKDGDHPDSQAMFLQHWRTGEPVIVSGITKKLDEKLWTPSSFECEFGEESADVVNCLNGKVLPGFSVRRFWKGFESIKDRPLHDTCNRMLLKLKDWPPGADFSDKMPVRFRDLMRALPFHDYTQRDGVFNLVTRLPDFFAKPDLGPKMYNAYGSASIPSAGTTNLHLDMSDAVNVMVYVGIPEDDEGDMEVKDTFATVDLACCRGTRRRIRQPNEFPGALWHIYRSQDSDEIRAFLRKVARERKMRFCSLNDPIHDQAFYLDADLRDRLKKEHNVIGWSICQCLGDAVFIPAGAPHQVLNLHSCIKVAEDFVTPENIDKCCQLTQEFRHLSDMHTNHEDKLQVKNILFHTMKDAAKALSHLLPDHHGKQLETAV